MYLKNNNNKQTNYKWPWNWAVGRNQKNFEEHGTLFTVIWMFIEIRMLKSASKGSEENEKGSRKKKNLTIVSRLMVEMNVKGSAGEDSERDEEHIIGNWRKGDACYRPAKSLMKLCSTAV